MKILRTRKELTDFAARCRAAGSSVALVPTMGALHAGHLSLMNRAVADNDVVIASVFVNPTQFNDKADLEAYPRTEQADFELLDKAACTAVLLPMQTRCTRRRKLANRPTFSIWERWPRSWKACTVRGTSRAWHR